MCGETDGRETLRYSYYCCTHVADLHGYRIHNIEANGLCNGEYIPRKGKEKKIILVHVKFNLDIILKDIRIRDTHIPTMVRSKRDSSALSIA